MDAREQRDEELIKQRERWYKIEALEKKLKTLKLQQAELRKSSLTALDPSFVKRQLAKCSEEIDRINKEIEGA